MSLGENGIYTAKQISEVCLKFWEKLPKSVKPKPEQWTVYSCIVQSNSTESYNNLKVVSAGTGSKCLPYNRIDPGGLLLTDSHAEVMARRGFIRYLYHQLQAEKDISIFRFVEGIAKLRENIRFHFYTSHTPCGDASIVNTPERKRSIDDVKTQYSRKKIKLNDDGEFRKIDDDLLIGYTRTKPGRGDPTLSLSCSDKIARWIRLGIQGALLSRLIDEPIVFESLVVGGGCPFSYDAMYRALINRSDSNSETCIPPIVIPAIAQVKDTFQFRQRDDKNPSPNSIVWCSTNEKSLEISVCGRKLGATKKQLSNVRSCSLMISRKNLFKKFIEVAVHMDIKDTDPTKSYSFHKNLAATYVKKSNFIKNTFLDIEKPQLCVFDFNAL